ncbi:MAG: ATP-binding protein [Chitinophagales bacterium]
MIQHFIGRKREIKRLEALKKSHKSEFVAVYGRRRVGKTLLIRHVFNNDFSFYTTATVNVKMQQQLFTFHSALMTAQHKSAEGGEAPKNWFIAFQRLITYLENLDTPKKVIFFDELPWFDTPKSSFLQALDHFWNSWASARTDIILIVCGSAASWMINKLINHKGGLHNRVTAKIQLEPFDLKEAEEMLRLKNRAITRYQVIQLYMVVGGVPFYLEAIEGGKSPMQNIEEVCFAKDGLLRTEFENLFGALFSNSEKHTAIVKAIATKAKGLTRNEIIELTKLSVGSGTTRVLNELEHSGFIRRYRPFSKKKRNSLYQLVDFYTHFYLRFIQNTDPYDENNWLNAMDTPAYRTWSGYAFEQVCLYHVSQIKKALGISGVITHTFAWKSKDNKGKKSNAAQIDLVIDRRDGVINLCEIKFSISPFTITKSYAKQLQNKMDTFRLETETKKAIHLTMITTYGLKENSWSMQIAQNDLNMEMLFEV